MTKTSATAIRLTICTILLTFAAVSVADAQPVFSKVFVPNTIGPGSVTTLTFTITNGSGAPITDLAFVDVLPTVPGDVDIADPANAFTDCPNAVLTAPAGGGTITFSNGLLGAFQTCTVSVAVTASTPGTHTNLSGDLTSSAGNSGTATRDLIVITTLPGFSKSFAPSSVPLGGRSTLTFTIDNSANGSVVGNLDFTDNLPTGMEIAAPSNATTDCRSSNPIYETILLALPGTRSIVLDANGSNLFPGFEVLSAGATCTATVDVVATGIGMLDNVSGELLADFVSCGTASATLEVTVTPLALRKSFTDDPVPPGGTVELEFTIDNFDRNFAATEVAFTDDLTTMVPALAGLTFSSLLSNDCGGSVSGVGGTTIGFSGGAVPPESTCTIRTSLSVPGGATPGAYTNTTSTITATIDGSPVVGNTAIEDLFVEPVPMLTKEFLEDGTLLPDPVVQAGDDVVLQFTIENSSTTSDATDIAFLDELTTFLPYPVTAVLPANPCGAGSTLGWAFPGGDRQALSLTGGNLTAAPGAGSTCTFDVVLTVPADVAPGTYVNTTEEIFATVDGAPRIGEPATDDFVVVAAPDLQKAFTDDPVAPGGTATLEFTLSHHADAPGDATGITFTDDLNALVPAIPGLTATLPPNPDPPCGAGSSLTASAGDTLLTLMGGTLSPGESCTFSVTLNVPPAAASGSHSNETSGVGATVEGTPVTSPPASDDLVVSGLIFSKEFIDDPVIPGDTVTLRFTIENLDPLNDAANIQFVDNLALVLPGTPDLTLVTPLPTTPCGPGSSLTPGGPSFLLFAGGEIMAGDPPCTFDVTVLVPAGAANGTYPNITGTLTSSIGNAIPAIDVLAVSSTLLQLTKEFTDDPVAPGGTANLRFTLTNLDAVRAASGIAFTDNLGAALSGLSATGLPFAACGGTVDAIPDAGTIDYSGGSLGAGAQCQFDVSVAVPAAASANPYTNTTSGLTGTIGGFAVSGDPASDDLLVVDLLDFAMSFDGPTTATGAAVMTFTITNPGANPAVGIAFTDDLDAMISGALATNLPLIDVCGPGSMITGTSFLALTGGGLPPMGGTCSFAVNLLIPAAATAGTFPNTTSELTQSGLPVGLPATANLVIEPPPSFAKAFAPAMVGQGLPSTLTFTIDNSASTLAAASLNFTDNLPAGMVVATPANATTTCTGGTLTAVSGAGVISYTGGTVAAASTCTVQVDVLCTVAGALVNTTGDLTSSSGDSGAANDTLVVNVQSGFSKVFAPGTISLGDVSTLTLTIDNTASTVDATGLDFTDNLPAGVIIASPAGASTTCTGGTLTAVSGTGVVSYTGGSVSAGAACTVSVDVISNTAGTHVNITGDLTSSLGNSGPATAVLTMEWPTGIPTLFPLGILLMISLVALFGGWMVSVKR